MKTLPLIPLLLLALGAPAQEMAAPKDRESFSFVVYGDRTGGRPDGLKILGRAVAATNRLDPAFTMTVGDMVQGYSDGAAWLSQMREYKAVMDRLERPWYPVAGNHDVYGGRKNRKEGNVALYKEHFGPLWYSFDYKWAHFVVLFSDEMLSFRDAARTQNVGPEQMAWLVADLEKTKAKQVFVFLHHPRWLYRGTNWPSVHRILAKDGRVKGVFAGHIHYYRDDGVRDGVHYYTLSVTGANASTIGAPSALHHVNHARCTPDSFTMSVMPVGAVLGANLAIGPEVDRLQALRRGDWLETKGALTCDLEQTREGTIRATLDNPSPTPTSYELRLDAGGGVKGEPAFVGGLVAAGGRIEQEFKVTVPAFAGPRPLLRLDAALWHPLKSGIALPVHHFRLVPIRITNVPSAAGRANKVLVLDGKSALRVETGRIEAQEFTLECWARGEAPHGSRALVSKTEQSSFGLWWSYRERQRPYASVGFHGTGYLHADSKRSWDWSKWTHLAVACGGGKVRYFVNGKLQTELDAPGLRSTNAFPLYIGADTDRRAQPGYHFRGAIDEVRLSSVVRYTRSFRPARTFRRDRATYLLFHFDGDLHGLHPDDSGNDRHAWAVGKPRLEEERR